MYNPKVSIIIPVYNGSNYMRQAIDSALKQSYKNIEVIVINDGSNDDGLTEEIALSYGNVIRYYKKENGGSSSALNYGISKMSGDYFSWLSHDDLYHRDKIKMQIEALNQYKDKDAVYLCGDAIIDANGNEIKYARKKLTGVYTGARMLQKFVSGYAIGGCNLLIPRTVFDKCGMFNENLKYLNDLECWYRFMLHSVKFVCKDETLVKTRVHSQSVTATKRELFNREKEEVGNYILSLIPTNYMKNKEFFRWYYLLSLKDRTQTIARDIKKVIKEQGDYDIKIRILSCLYKWKGMSLYIIKTIWHKLKTRRI